MAPPLTVAVLGAGVRGQGFAKLLAAWPERARVVAVAEPRREVRQRFARDHHLAPERVFADWRDLARQPKLADCAIICLPDSQHVAAAIALTGLGYHLLVESPLSTDWAGCLAVADAVRRRGTLLVVCHVLRYMAMTKIVKRVLAQGAIGDIVAIDHVAPVGVGHFAHSFVRGRWAKESQSSYMLLGFAGHDIDWLLNIVGSPPSRVSCQGSLSHFRPECAPAQAAERCVGCALEPTCLYSAPRFYQHDLAGPRAFVLAVTGGDTDPAALEAALAAGPYGRCVYRCDNDAPDHQVVSVEFANGVTAALTVTAFTAVTTDRRMTIFGTRGQMTVDMRVVEVRDFRTGVTTVFNADQTPFAVFAQGGAEWGVLDAFLTSLQEGRRDRAVADLDAVLRGQWLVFAAVQSRRLGRTIDLEGYPLDAERRLVQAMRSGDRSQADQLIGQLLGALYLKSEGNLTAVAEGAGDLIRLFTAAAVDAGADAEVVFGAQADLAGKLGGFASIDDISTFLSDAFNRFTGYIFDFAHSDHANALRRAVAFIDDHYSERIRLADVAAAAWLSPGYLSEILKAKLGKTFTDYLAEVRVQHSKDLLVRTAIPIAEIATRVGFSDQSHFTKVFTRVTGTSPARFRRSGGA